MGKAAKTSRKGKKAWRANIKTDDIDDYFVKKTKDSLCGASDLAEAPIDSICFDDKSQSTVVSDIPVKRKIEKRREKILHHERVLEKNAYVKPVPSSTLKKCKKKKKDFAKSKSETQNTSNDGDIAPAVVDIWNDKGEANVKARKVSRIFFILLVLTLPPGCSFNPPFEAHQDSLAQAVADEMQKVYQKELAPQPVPLVVAGEVFDEEDKLFLDADGGDESDLGEEDMGNDGGEQLADRKPKEKRVTRVVQNRRNRRKEQLKAEEEAKKKDNFSKEIDSLSDIMKEIAEEDEDKKRRHLRREVAKQEKLKSGPPRLGKHKFKPAPMQVLLTEEISGSLRKLKACPTLVRDRYKSFEKRGLLVPRAK
ncbi:uncharacterized protein At2g40430 [Asparagus officinalis]|uniref:uncharacterized protein At2g40430 n=1 Tax=Asparagus officinalis TaxID=4686 RepID=UPI00098E0499|nr:uncharacterized protein At2g40430 [Asparagus officinalis]